jgi:hypothetical protein
VTPEATEGNGTGRVGRCEDRRAGVHKADLRLRVDVHVAVAEIDPESGLGRKGRDGAVGAGVLDVVHGGDVVAILVDVHGGIEAGPGLRIVARVNLVALHLARADAREGIVVVAEDEVGLSRSESMGRAVTPAAPLPRGSRTCSARVVACFGHEIGARTFLDGAVGIEGAPAGRAPVANIAQSPRAAK